MLIAGGSIYKATVETTNVLFGVLRLADPATEDLVARRSAPATLISIGAFPAGLASATRHRFLERELVKVPNTAVVQMMQRGVIDAAFVGEPTLSAFRNDLRDIGHSMDAISKEFLYSAWYAMRDWVEADRPRARRAVAAIYETARWANTHQAESLALFVREFNLEPDRFRSMIRSEWSTTLTPQLIQPILNICTRAGIFDRPVDAKSIIATI